MPATIIENYNSNDPRTEGENYLLEVFRTTTRFEGWTVFEQPHINSMKPDFILTHPQKGILIIEVKDWNLNSKVYDKDGYIRGTDGNYYKSNPINQVEYYKKNILHYQLSSSVNLSESFSSDYFACIETIVYFHYASKDVAMKYCNATNSRTKIWTKTDIDYIKCIENQLNINEHTYVLSRNYSKFSQNGLLENLVTELNFLLQHADYNQERRQPFILTSDQKKLADLNPGSIRRWSGVAGSGKSLIIAEKAVQAAKSDKKVLILSFNITLRHYLKDLCSQQFGPRKYEGERKKFSNITFSHFHDFLKLILTEHQLEVNLDEEIDPEGYESKLMKTANDYFQVHDIKRNLIYDYILIDEGQDFKAKWILFLKRFFNGSGELLIVYDKAQNLYGHGVWIEDSNQIKDIGFKGKPGHLKYTHRLPSKIVQKIDIIRQKLQLDCEEILSAKQEQESFFQKAFWYNYRPQTRLEKLQQIVKHLQYLCQSNLLEDITILTTNENTGAEIVKYVSCFGAKTSHVYDLNRQQNIERRRVEKWKFQGGTGRLKVCSYHSFKGWQTPNILLILDSPTTNYKGDQIYVGSTQKEAVQNALFISLSRVKGRADNGEYTFTCLNYLPEYEYLSSIFDEQYDTELPF